MGITRIDYNLCNGCGICVDNCPMDVLRIDEKTGRPFVKYFTECQSCFLCERDCLLDAIYVTSTRVRGVPLPK